MLSRRELLLTTGALPFVLSSRRFDPSSVEALTFDVFGTVVDWRGSIIEEGNRVWKPRGVEIDWGKFADRWRAGYQPAMARVRSGELPWTNLDALHRMILDGLLSEFGIANLSEADKDHLNRIWHRLNGWPDAVSGLTRLKKRFVIATLSNGNVSLLTHMAKHAGLPWDVVLSAELAKHYKPDPEVYLMAADLLGLPPDRVMMVAAHPTDLAAAGKLSMRTAYVHRPLEFGPDSQPQRPEAGSFDVAASDFVELAAALGT
jgi:2-haloacid dehalogenase